ncbi:flagellar motor switch protein FliM [Desulfosarcina sp. OttesenSCG-928-G10]|nr:flagellar motor switch protein FliM [Desulfosarcina sp. OttesenSCG-928-G10]MDL2321877.1 flagellar motor switch protein FliM [Desulfosarcina sp. OttesenSCG-928-B08]
MADQVLSQEEIDALLSAMDSGDLETIEQSQQDAAAEIRPYDLTVQYILQRGQFDALEEVCDKFSNLYQDSLSTLFQQSVSTKIISKEMVKFGEFMKAFSTPTGFIIFGMEPLIGSALLAFEPNLVFSLIDGMFGGNGKPMEKIREFTLIEKRMLEKMGTTFLKDMEQAWEKTYAVHFSVRKVETKPEFVFLVNPNDQLIIFVFSITTKVFSGNVHLGLPYLMLEPIKEHLSSSYLRERDRATTFGDDMIKLIGQADVNIVAELGSTVRTVKDVLNIEVGDVIPLNTGPQNPVILNIERVPKFLGMPGVVKGNKAVQLTEVIYAPVNGP